MQEKKTVTKLAIWLALMGVYLGWGTTFLANHYVLEAFPAFISNGVRNFLAGAILYIFLRLRGAERPTAQMWKSSFITGSIMICCGSGLNVWGQSVVPSGISALLIGSTPLWMVILEIIISRRAKTPGPNAAAVLGVLIGFAGIILLIGPGNLVGTDTRLHPVGTAALLIGSFFWSLGSLKSRTAVLPSSPILKAGTLMIAGGLSLVVAGILTGELARLSVDRVTLASCLGFVYTLFGTSLFAFVLYTWLLSVAPVTLVSTFAFVNPVVAVILGALILGEVISPRLLVASALIIAAVALVIAASGKKPAPKPSAQSPPDSE
ncbi:MAG: EamA family transporter [Spirochaetaceae bacterium]|nr:EamA family transporter [Spirochaetaceae bacterium]